MAVSRRKNSVHDITGVLLASKGYFCQVIEGAMSEVEQLFERIQLDDRHHEICVMDYLPVPARLFGGWDMAFTNLDLPGHAQNNLDAVLQNLNMSGTGRNLVDSFAKLILQRERFRE